MASSASEVGAETPRRTKDASSLVLPTRNSCTSNSPPSSTIRAKALRRMSESIRWPCMVTVSWTIGRPLQLGQGELRLRLVLALLVGVRDLAVLVALEEEHLGDALVGVDLRGQRRGVGDLEGDD